MYILVYLACGIINYAWLNINTHIIPKQFQKYSLFGKYKNVKTPTEMALRCCPDQGYNLVVRNSTYNRQRQDVAGALPPFIPAQVSPKLQKSDALT
jgi:hypothetical protein